jgi:hypothetical protein
MYLVSQLESYFFYVNATSIFVAAMVIWLTWPQPSFSSFIQRFIWVLLLLNICLIASQEYLVCFLLPSSACPYLTVPLIFRILFLVPDLVFLAICNGIYLMLRSRSNRREEPNTNGEVSEIGLLPVFDGNSIFVSGTILVLVMGALWRVGLMQVANDYR